MFSHRGTSFDSEARKGFEENVEPAIRRKVIATFNLNETVHARIINNAVHRIKNRITKHLGEILNKKTTIEQAIDEEVNALKVELANAKAN